MASVPDAFGKRRENQVKTVVINPEEWAGEHLELEGSTHHHLFRVGRLAAGDSLRLVDGKGGARLGVIETIDKRLAQVRLGDRLPSNEPAVQVQALVVAPKKPRAEWLVEKTTEVGVGAVRFLRSERGPRSFGESAFERFRRIAVSAAQQCGRAVVPQISGMHELDELAGLIESSAAAFALDPSGERLAPGSEDSISLLVGPEGGWSCRELDRFAELGIRLAGLGDRVMRVETAAVVAVSTCVIPD